MLRSMRLWAMALAPMLVFAGCPTAPPSVQGSDPCADIQGINALREKFAASYDAHSVGGAAACFADGAVLMHASLEAIEGRQAIGMWLEAYFKVNPATVKHTPLGTRVGGDWA